MTCTKGAAVGGDGSGDAQVQVEGPGEREGPSIELSARFASVKADMEASLRRVRELGAHLRAGSQTLETVKGKIEQQISLCTPRASPAPRSVAVGVQPTENLLEEQQKMANFVSDLANRFSVSAPTSPRTDSSPVHADPVPSLSSNPFPASQPDQGKRDFAMGPVVEATLAGSPKAKVGDMQWGCEFHCGFRGSFDTVSEHERHCKVRHSSRESTERPYSQNDMSQLLWNCHYGCGYESKFRDVEVHEKTCTHNPAQERLSTPRAQSLKETSKAIWSCEYKCGFASSFEQVAEHETACEFSPNKRVQTTQAAAGSGDSASDVQPETRVDTYSLCAPSSEQTSRVLAGSLEEWQQTDNSASFDVGSTSMCGLGIRFREDGEGRLHVEHLIEGGAGKTSRVLQIGDTLKELDGATMQASVCRPGGCLPCTRGVSRQRPAIRCR